MHASAYTDAERFVKIYVADHEVRQRIADIGADDVNGCLRPLFPSKLGVYVGYDLQAGPNVDVVLRDPYRWPEIPDGYYDVVVSSQTIEHVPKPWLWVREIARITRPGGLVYISTPNTIGYHPYPIDCWRLWPDGMRAVMEDAGLSVLECYALGMDTTGIARK